MFLQKRTRDYAHHTCEPDLFFWATYEKMEEEEDASWCESRIGVILYFVSR